MLDQSPDYSITFACLNAVDVTRRCVQSLIDAGTPLERVVVVDNASNDGTRAFLDGQGFGQVLYNRRNLGCGTAWNQGALARQSEWTIVMNNDVLVAPGWAGGLIAAAEQHDLRIASPAMVEGDADYDFQDLAARHAERARGYARIGWAHAVCMCIHESVFAEIGYFRPTPSLLGFEDTIFFNDARRAGIRLGAVGDVWIHHLGSITQKQMKLERGLSLDDELSLHDKRRLLGQSWMARKLERGRRKRDDAQARRHELERFDFSLLGQRVDGRFVWR
ncbi:MAG: glycosyltransferase [Burkholderiaceae bacterium]